MKQIRKLDYRDRAQMVNFLRESTCINFLSRAHFNANLRRVHPSEAVQENPESFLEEEFSALFLQAKESAFAFAAWDGDSISCVLAFKRAKTNPALSVAFILQKEEHDYSAIKQCLNAAITYAESLGIVEFRWPLPQDHWNAEVQNNSVKDIISSIFAERYQIFTEARVPAYQRPVYSSHLRILGGLTWPVATVILRILLNENERLPFFYRQESLAADSLRRWSGGAI